MSIQVRGNCFLLDTAHTSYRMEEAQLGYLMHTYYGPRLPDASLSWLYPAAERSFSPNPPGCEGRDFSLDTLPQEYAACGLGDFRVSPLAAVDAGGHRAADLRVAGYELPVPKPDLEGLPSVLGGAGAETLRVDLADGANGLAASLYYTVYEELDVITRCVRFENRGAAPLQLEKAASLCLDFPAAGLELVHLWGGWGAERRPERLAPSHGVQSFGSTRGTSSHQHNPFFALCAPGAGEETGEAYGFALVYSGNHLTEIELTQFDTLRCVMGIHPQGFCWRLEPGGHFFTPEAVLTFSANGLGGMSRSLHRFIRGRICRGPWAGRRRPVLLNNWEATYFNFDEEAILRLARQAAPLGIELLVLDDGWFGRRDSDTCSLGDWDPHPRKLPGGLARLAEKVRAEGLLFGLWMEPEMVSPDSELYRAHPDWCLHLPGRGCTTGRDQLVLDLSRPEVLEEVWRRIDGVLRSAPISYLKWDMNRHLTEVGSAAFPPEQQGEIYHRYVLGVYGLMARLNEAYPDLLLENCSGGGGRFDLGMLCYSPQIWASDDTDAAERAKIQYGSSLCYPLSCMGAHVSAVPNHQTGRLSGFGARGHVAVWGAFGYELDPAALTEEEKRQVRGQCAFYKQHAAALHQGEFYRLSSPFSQNLAAWAVRAAGGAELFVLAMQLRAEANGPRHLLRLPCADPSRWYRETAAGAVYSGAALRAAGFPLPFARGDSATWLYHFTAVPGAVQG